MLFERPWFFLHTLLNEGGGCGGGGGGGGRAGGCRDGCGGCGGDGGDGDGGHGDGYHTVSAVIFGGIIRYKSPYHGDLLLIFPPNIDRSIIGH